MLTGEEIADIYDKAAALIRQQGWCQGMVQDQNGRVCLMGALLEAHKGPVAEWPVLAEGLRGFPSLVRDLREWAGTLENLISWNDQLGRTQEDVLELLETRATVLRSLVAPAGPVLAATSLELPDQEPVEVQLACP